MGEDIGQQAALLSEETRNPDYTEPLWRRIQPGSETITERVTGGSDPANPACVASGEGSLPASPSPVRSLPGPVRRGRTRVIPAGIINENGGQTGDFVPRLSADGYLVAFVSQAPLVGQRRKLRSLQGRARKATCTSRTWPPGSPAIRRSPR